MRGRVSTYVRRQHLALVVVFLAVTGGTSYALDGTDTVFSDDIVNGEVRTLDVLDDGVRSIDVRDDTLAAGGLTAPDLAPGSVGASEIYDDSVRTEDVRGGLIAADLGPGSIGASELADQPWTGSEIDEATLGTVPVATLAGKGRWAADHVECESPDTAAFVTCAVLPITIERPARLLIVAAGRNSGGWTSGRCRAATDAYVSGGELVPARVSTDAQNKVGSNFLWTKVFPSLPLPPGDLVVKIECRGDYFYYQRWTDLQLSVVALNSA